MCVKIATREGIQRKIQYKFYHFCFLSFDNWYNKYRTKYQSVDTNSQCSFRADKKKSKKLFRFGIIFRLKISIYLLALNKNCINLPSVSHARPWGILSQRISPLRQLRCDGADPTVRQNKQHVFLHTW